MSPRNLLQARIDDEDFAYIEASPLSRSDWLRAAIKEKRERDQGGASVKVVPIPVEVPTEPAKKAPPKRKPAKKAAAKKATPQAHVGEASKRCPHRYSGVCEECAKEFV